MISCSRCGAFLRPSHSCPSCGGGAVVSRSAVAMLLGLSVACTGDAKGTDSAHSGSTSTDSTHSTLTEPDYGVAIYHSAQSDTDTDTDTDTDSDTDTDPHSGTTQGHTGATHTGSVQVDYGTSSTN